MAWAREDHFYVDNVATTSVARGSGVGRELLARAEERARTHGLEEVLYTNAAMVENTEYYERHGFEVIRRGDDSGFERVYLSKKL